MPERERDVDPARARCPSPGRAARRRAPSAPSTLSAPPSRPASARTSAPARRSPARRAPATTQRPSRRTSSKPVVRAATYSSSTSPSATSTCRTPRASARSVPGTGCTNTSARSAVGVRRGSITTTLPPRARSASRWRAAGGMVSARFDPTRTSTSVCSTSASGNGSPRSRPKARLPARRGRRHAPAAVVVDLAGAERDPGELAELVGLLVGQPAAAEHGDRVGPALGLESRAAAPRSGRAPRPS